MLIKDPARDWVATVDEGIRDWVLMLWAHGIETVFSCQDLSDCYGRQVVLKTGEHLDLALKLLPWAGSAARNYLGYISIVENDVREDANTWVTIWEREDEDTA